MSALPLLPTAPLRCCSPASHHRRVGHARPTLPPPRRCCQAPTASSHRSCWDSEPRHHQGDDAVHRRRSVLALLGLAAASAVAGAPAPAAEAATVRLQDVESQALQDGLRAAVAGDFLDADRLFTRLLQEDPGSASVWSNRGSVRLSLGRYEDAAQDFSTAIRLAPGAPVPLLNRSIAYEALGRYQEAISDCESAIAADPKEYAAWFNLGNVQVRVKEYEAALNSYAKASSLAPGIAGYRLKQAMVLFELNRREESKKLFQGLVRKYPYYTEAHAALAAVLWTEGQRSWAEEQFTQTTYQEPKFKDIRWVATELQWLPGMVHAMSDLLAIQ